MWIRSIVSLGLQVDNDISVLDLRYPGRGLLGIDIAHLDKSRWGLRGITLGTVWKGNEEHEYSSDIGLTCGTLFWQFKHIGPLGIVPSQSLPEKANKPSSQHIFY